MRRILFLLIWVLLSIGTANAACAPGTPAPAAAMNYCKMTFGPVVSMGTNWFNSNTIDGGTPTATTNSDGSVTLTNPSNAFNAGIETAQKNGQSFTGHSYGGGGYFEATIAITNTPTTSGGWPSFWSNGIEGKTGPLNSAGFTYYQWPGQVTGYSDNIENDFFELQGGRHTSGLHNWYSNVGATQIGTSGNPNMNFPAGTDLTQRHKFGALWVPATSTAQGYMKYYFDNVQSPNNNTWNQYNASLGPPPTQINGVGGGSAYSVMDVQHLYLILGSGPSNPITISAVTVWQTSGANDNPVVTSPTASANNTAVISVNAPVIDSAGNTWTFNSSARLTVNGAAILSTSGVVEIAYVNQVIWQKTSAGNWFSMNPDATVASGPTTTSPLGGSTESPNNTVITTVGPAITDSIGGNWTITSGAQLALNGTAIAATSRVIEIAYVNGIVWQENADNNWYSMNSDGSTRSGPQTTSPLVSTGTVPVPAPLTGTVTPNPWVAFDDSYSGITLPCGKPFHYIMAQPAQYNPTQYKYPLYIWLHPTHSGDKWYLGNSAPTDLPGTEPSSFDTVSWQTRYPGFVVAPMADQTNGNGTNGSCTGAGNDAIINWGGWTHSGSQPGSGTLSTGDTGPNTFAILAMINKLVANNSIDTSRIYVDGFSLGGIASDYYCYHFNAYNGNPAVFAACAGSAGVDMADTPVTTAIATQMRSVPQWQFSGANDTASPPGSWNTPLCTALGGTPANLTAITSASANQCGTSQMRYTLCPTCGHQDTDASGNPVWTNQTIHDFLFGVSATVSTNFRISGGKIISPTGAIFTPEGINLDDGDAPVAIANASAQPLTTLFPGINYIRLNISPSGTTSGTTGWAYQHPASYYVQFVNWATANHIVVNLEDHSSNGGFWENSTGADPNRPSYPPTGAVLTQELNFFKTLATQFKGNPYVWFGSLNEIDSADGTYSTSAISAISTYVTAFYNAIRSTGNTSIVQLGAGLGGGNPGTVGANSGFGTANFASMTNIVWYLHSYYTNGTNAGALAQVQGSTAACCGGSGGSGYLAAQTIQSADGVVPVIFDEYGSGTGNSSNGDGTAIVAAMRSVAGTNNIGSSGWGWYPSPQWQMVINGNISGGPFSLTTWGTEVAGMITAVTGPTTAPGQVTGLATGTPGSATVPLTWTAPSGNPTAYTVQSSPHSAGTWTTQTSTATQTNYTVTGLTPSTSYDFRVAASNAGGLGTYSTTATVSTAAASGGGGPAGIATPANLVAYFNQIKGTHTVSGQYVERGNNATFGQAAVNTIQSQTGQWLGMLGGAYYAVGQTTAADTTFNTYAINYWQSGGLIILQANMPNPTTGGPANDVSSLTVSGLLTAGQQTNTNFVNSLNQIGTGLQALQNAGVVVVLQVFPESNGNWWWWGAGLQTAAQFQAMWQYAYNYWTVTMGLNNLVFDWSINAGTALAGRTQTDTFPGSAYVNVVSEDLYSSTPSNDSGGYAALSALGLPIGLSEFGAGSSGCGDTTFSMPTLITAFKSNFPNMVFWQQWWSANTVSGSCPSGAGWGMEVDQNTSTALADPWVINRGAIQYSGTSGSAVTWNSGDRTTTINLSNLNLTATSTVAAPQSVRATLGYTTGKYCFSATANTITTDWALGLANATYNLALTGGIGADSNAIGFYAVSPTQAIYFGGVRLSAGTTADVSGDQVMECVDLVNKLFWVDTPVMRAISQNWNNSTSANPATGVGGLSFSGMTCPCFPIFNTLNNASVATANMTGPFPLALPSGFSPWSSVAYGTCPSPLILGANDNLPPTANDNHTLATDELWKLRWTIPG